MRRPTTSPNAGAEVEVVVEELVLVGWPEGDRDCIAETFQRELVRLLARRVPRPLAAGEGSCDTVDAGRFTASRRHESVGEAAALRVYEALGRSRGPRQRGRPAP